MATVTRLFAIRGAYPFEDRASAGAKWMYCSSFPKPNKVLLGDSPKRCK